MPDQDEIEKHHNRKSHYKVQVCRHSFFEIDNSFIYLFVFNGRFKKTSGLVERPDFFLLIRAIYYSKPIESLFLYPNDFFLLIISFILNKLPHTAPRLQRVVIVLEFITPN